MYEKFHQKPIPKERFLLRLSIHIFISSLVVLISLFVGMVGYNLFEKLSWTDAFLNAAMILGGMGPVNIPTTEGGKIFAGLYALYSGLIFLIAFSIILVPLFHRILHLFHWKNDV